MIRIITSLALLFYFFAPAFTQTQEQKKLNNWYNKDLQMDKVFGISTEKAYKELLKNKKSQTVIVAVIDGGTDIMHEDLKENIWVNADEIPGNGIDDDKNGYIDDIHGWNFIGNAKGENVDKDNLEVTRLYKELDPKYRGKDKSSVADKEEFELYQKVKEVYNEKSQESQANIGMAQSGKELKVADSIVKAYLKKPDYSLKDLKKLNKAPAAVAESAEKLRVWQLFGISADDLIAYGDEINSELTYHYNLDFDGREIVGDDYKDNSNRFYGNNDVTGPEPAHGTFVAGEIGAVRNNGKGVDGIASDVKLMIIRVVPNGDERDKDVANGIRYAIENGAKVINMSFGKAFSPQKKFVDEVLPLADKYDVLLVHAAGNDAENNDLVANYPTHIGADGKPITNNWLTVGASSMKVDDDLAANFSNYGTKTVDLFAPGVDLWGTKPGNRYGAFSGTSMASPVVAGMAAVIRSYYPQLSASEVKEAIMKSVTSVDQMVQKPTEAGKGERVSFSTLSVSGGVANLYNALLIAEQIAAAKK
ncbi:MAG TPA: S8 family serine peptidase [Bacteroidales bacterium]|nr:S8 family serine peptidase [Bacteroidales bacterium]